MHWAVNYLHAAHLLTILLLNSPECSLLDLIFEHHICSSVILINKWSELKLLLKTADILYNSVPGLICIGMAPFKQGVWFKGFSLRSLWRLRCYFLF
eukprot:c24123_g2_i2 orf=190-480(-)